RHTRFSRDWSSDVCSSDLYCTCRVYPSCFCRIRPITDKGKCADELYGRHFAQMKKENRACAMSSFHRRLFAARMLLERAIARTRSEERRVGKECRARGSPR